MGSRSRVITSLFAFQSREEYENSGRLTYNPRKDADRNFLDDLCYEIHDLPTIQAAVERTPRLSTMPIYSSYRHNGNFGSYSSRGVEINMAMHNRESRESYFEAQLTTLPHELRHGYQDARGCMKLVEDPRVQPHLEDHILFDRVIEADATAFSLTVMYELLLLHGREEPLNRAWEVHRGSVEAYWNVAGYDSNTHWNGAAAQAAFDAYFLNDNSERLKGYDLKLCEEFFRAAEEGEKAQAVRVPSHFRQDLFADYMKPISKMPFMSKSGNIIERNHYRPESCGCVMSNLAPETQDFIERSRRLCL